MRKEVKKTDILKQPEYPGGQKALRAFVASNLKYPDQALALKVEGTVHLRYAIDHKGMVIDVRILHKLGHGCDEEAERLVRLLSFHVDKTRGVKVLYHKKIQIHFRLPQQPQNQTELQVSYHITPTPKKNPNQDKVIHYSIS
jgi:TonB family protein